MSTRRVTGGVQHNAKRAVPATSNVPSKSTSITLKRPAEDTPTLSGKKAKLDEAAGVLNGEACREDDEEEDEDEQSDDESGQEELSAEVQDRLDYLEGLVGFLTKSYLKDVMKGISFYGSRSGTNRSMAAAIVEDLTRDAQGGDDLKEQEKVIKGVYKSCYGGCAIGSDEEADDGEY